MNIMEITQISPQVWHNTGEQSIKVLSQFTYSTTAQ